MNTNSKRLSIYLVLMLIGTAIATTLRTIACLNDLNGGTGYFTDNSIISIATPIIWITAILSLTYIFVGSRVNLRPSFSTSATYIPTGMLGVATIFLGVRVLTHTLSAEYRYPILSKEVLTSPAFILAVAVFVLAILSIGYHFTNTYFVEAKVESRAFFAICTVAFLAIYGMLVYFDTSLPINNPGKIANQMAFLFAAIFFLYESRISLGRETWRAYTAFGLAATALTAYSSIPSIIVYYAKGYVLYGTQNGAFTSIEEYMMSLALFVFILSKIIIIINIKEEKENEYVTVLADFANAREAEVEDSFARFQETFASKQLSIFELFGEDDTVESVEETEDFEEEPQEEAEEPENEVMISDDAIYESIFGKMPEKESDDTEEETEPEIEEEPRDPEEVANELLEVFEAVQKEKDEK